MAPAPYTRLGVALTALVLLTFVSQSFATALERSQPDEPSEYLSVTNRASVLAKRPFAVLTRIQLRLDGPEFKTSTRVEFDEVLWNGAAGQDQVKWTRLQDSDTILNPFVGWRSIFTKEGRWLVQQESVLQLTYQLLPTKEYRLHWPRTSFKSAITQEIRGKYIVARGLEPGPTEDKEFILYLTLEPYRG